MPDESRVFDVSKPSKVSPSPTSKPVIVGHHPIMNDPMVREENPFGAEDNHETTKIPVTSDEPQTLEQAMAAHDAPPEEPKPEEQTADHGSPAIFSDPSEETNQSNEIIPMSNHPESVANGPFTETEPEPAATEPASEPEQHGTELPEPAVERSDSHIQGLHFEPKKQQRGKGKTITLAILLLLVAGYLVIDSGLVNAGFSFPFHIFKQKAKTTTTPAPVTNQPAATGPTLPAGFKEYKIAGTSLTFAAPTTWGDPTSTTDPGYSKRGGTNQSDGIYAYLVSFASNKDIQIAVTSDKFLPAARAATFYDFLQWCTGTNDGLIYQSLLNFSTANKVDTPSTITCDQGPVAGASKLNSTTIVQSKATDTASKVIGDIYTKNLDNDSLVVFRVKDAAMTNGSDIKQLLVTVQIPKAGGVTTTTTAQ